jgi:hypothetical protein
MIKASVSCWFLLLMFLATGCASAPKERVAIAPAPKERVAIAPPQEPGRQPAAVEVDAVDQKIARLEGLMKEKRIKVEDEALAAVVIKAYQSAKACLDENPHTPCDQVNHDLLQGLSLVEERYFSRTTAETHTAPATVSIWPPSTRNDGQDTGRPSPPEASQAAEKPAKEDRVDDAAPPHKVARESLQETAQPGTHEQTADPVEQGEEQQLRERIERIAMKEQGLSHAKQLVEAEKFEEAIAAIDTLGTEGSVSEASTALMDEAVAGIVNRERNRAAKAFYAAKQTDDPARKEAYLRTSHDILKQLLDKYHSSSLISKVKSNFETVKSEMAKLGLKP